ncbi:MAG: nitroreductase family protein [Saccharospirillum sp.]
MHTDKTDQALKNLQHRVSHPRLSEPGPTREQLNALYRAAMRAPDHAWLRPWRFIEARGDQRQKLGQWMADSALAEDSSLEDKQFDKLSKAPLRAPLVIVAVARVREHPKVPPVEQILATGAAITNLLNAAHAQGIGAVWRTGNPAYSPALKAQLGLVESDAIVGFLYLGTPTSEPKLIPDLDPADFVTELGQPIR